MGIRAADAVILAVERKATAKLQDPRTLSKICELDDRLALSFAGLHADARVLVNRARIECQSHRLSVEDAPSVEYVARFIANIQQKYTQTGGRRPFGISTLIGGFAVDKTPHLWQTDPSGTYSAWKANAIGRQSKPLREFLEKNYTDDITEAAAVKLAVRTLLEIVESGAKSIEIAVLRADTATEFLSEAKIASLVEEVEREKAESGGEDSGITFAAEGSGSGDGEGAAAGGGGGGDD